MGAPIYPLLILFGLNAVDELDRAAFGILLPDIRDHFGLTNSEALTLVSLTTIAVLLIEVPLSFYVDRRNRVRIATVGAGIWGVFALGTATAASVPHLAFMRVGAGGGRAVVTPTHNSLLSDYYRPESRVKVFSFHRQANSVGLILGPLIGGVLGEAFGWRVPFVVFAIPTFLFVVLALKMKEPPRGHWEREAGGASYVEEEPAGVWESMQILYRVRTMRRIWCAMPFLAIALLGVSQLLALVYEEVFGLKAGARGLIAAAVEPLQIVAVFFFMPRIAKIVMKDPTFLLRFVAVVGVAVGLFMVGLAYAPNVIIAVMMHALISGTIGTLAPAFFAQLSLVAPARVRAVGFSTISLFGIPGIAILLPVIGRISDRFGVQVSIVTLVPVTMICGLILASAAKFVVADMTAAFAAPDATADLDPAVAAAIEEAKAASAETAATE
ncbi:MAG: MFS transporter [Acidimicrobiales bacterium]|nr:MFS transporter [Acidimicrobiales bacterium]